MLMMLCCWNGKQPVCKASLSAQKFVGCSRFNQHSLGVVVGATEGKTL